MERMEREPVKRPPPSGIPRLSRLPLPTTAATKAIRPSPSRERLQADQGLNVSRLRRPSEDVFKKPHLPPPSQRKISENVSARRESYYKSPSVRAAASMESLSSRRKSQLHRVETEPSLEERTVETLAQIPSSPTPSRRQSDFFRPSSPIRSPSRPSSIIYEQPTLEMASTAALTARLPVAEGSSKPMTPKRSVGKLRGVSGAARKASHNNLKEDSAVPLSRTPSYGDVKSIPLRNSTSRKSLNKAFDHLNSFTLGATGVRDSLRLKELKHRNASSARSSTLTSPTSIISKASQRTSVTSGSNCSDSVATTHDSKKAPKSSSALRESIAKAKAARKFIKQNNSKVDFADPFDNLSIKDPFSPIHNGGSNKEVLRNRTMTARKSGSLNIAALGLKELPHEVMTMYDYNPEINDNWYETVDLVKLMAADNEFESLAEEAFPDIDPSDIDLDEDAKGNQFGGLEVLDLHGNLLTSLPIGLRKLDRLHSLNLAKNRLNMDAIEVVTQIMSLSEVKLGNNDLEGMLTPQLGSLQKLEVLDLRGNALTGLPDNLSDLTALRVLNVAENQLTSLPFSALSKLPLVEINAQKNRLHGSLIPAWIRRIEGLQVLNISGNALEKLSAGDTLELPSLQQMFADANRIKTLPNVSSWKSLLTLVMEDNQLSNIPQGFTELRVLKNVDFKSNNISTLDEKIGLMENLVTFHIGNNPLRDRRFLTLDTEDLKRDLRTRCSAEETPDAEDGESSDHTEFTLAPEDPQTSHMWQLKSGGVLDRSSTELSRLAAEDLEHLISSSEIRCLYLQSNRLEKLPTTALSLISHSLTDLDLSNNPMDGDNWISTRIELAHLRNLNLASTRLKSLDPLQKLLFAPLLTFLDVSGNRIDGALPAMRTSFPKLITLLASDNKIEALSFHAVQGLQTLDVSNNNIDSLPPRLGLLGVEHSGGLRRLDISGNSFRVPRYQIVSKGTEAVLEWLKNRITPEEMKEWQGDVEEG
ncbi:hypothetical protein LOZ12_005321 [Ophidiomyces ophidiicola]|uniref:Uncharacterized protein n=1 Tax=Ophidiomyces ophidiicola TaxID=1387563 RepID=A0ACB8USK5_9EURO|nr:hypothetical protein LOZ62_005505 [Ophidiomyces ophidiicola]KAI1950855.1 hypothetical protein LOZ59_005701 [Ophidiomyces ophidiicola]KAI1968592.1 hypothetical protein LOZ56_004968 [Ophidiomyces ophidiicola]KAI2011156.1 hypothetical protein LOZ46_006189 [Ophidiomyces ophidiicola]KAI2019153.1 hypothetical protein LOZ45_005668 [Ophidiomyces ophidiicola]